MQSGPFVSWLMSRANATSRRRQTVSRMCPLDADCPRTVQCDAGFGVTTKFCDAGLVRKCRRHSSQPQQSAGPSAGKTRLESLQEVSGHSDNSSPFAAVQQPFQ